MDALGMDTGYMLVWMMWGLLCIGGIAFQIWLAYWGYKDGEKRGKDGTLIALLMFIGGLLGAIVWLLVRPPEEKSPDHF